MKLMRLTLNIMSLHCFKLSKRATHSVQSMCDTASELFEIMLYILKHKNVKTLLLHNCKNSLILKIFFHFPRIFSPSGPFLAHTCQQSHSSKVHISSSVYQRTFIPHIHRPDWLTPTERQWAHTRRQMEVWPSPCPSNCLLCDSISYYFTNFHSFCPSVISQEY